MAGKPPGPVPYRPAAMPRDDPMLGFGPSPSLLPTAFPGPLYGAMVAGPHGPMLMPVKAMTFQSPQFMFHQDLVRPYGADEEVPQRAASSSWQPTHVPPLLDGSAGAGPQRGSITASSGPAGGRKKYTLIPTTDPMTPTAPSPAPSSSAVASARQSGPDHDPDGVPPSPGGSASMKSERDPKVSQAARGRKLQGSGRKVSRSPPKSGPSVNPVQPQAVLAGSPAPRPPSFTALPPVARAEPGPAAAAGADGPPGGFKFVVDLPLPISTPPHRVQKLTADCKVSPRRPVAAAAPAVSQSRIVWADAGAAAAAAADAIQARLPPDVQTYMQEVQYQPHEVVCAATPADEANYFANAADREDQEEIERWVRRVYDIVKTSYKTETLQRPAELLSFLYLGDVTHARALPLLTAMGISAVLNCAPGMTYTTQDHYPPHFLFHAVHAEDTLDYRLLARHLDEACHAIEQARLMGRRILVHCFAGINRSATLCIAYLMVHLRWPLLAAVRHVYQARPIILTNRGFMAELVRLAKARGLLDDPPARPPPELAWPFAGFARA
eukprot:EG_transcript_6347